MRGRLNIVFALAAGLLGGLISHYVSLESVHAQAQAPIPKEIRAQKFILVNERGEAFGLFGFDPNGRPIIKLVDERGNTLWSSRPEPLRRSPSGE